MADNVTTPTPTPEDVEAAQRLLGRTSGYAWEAKQAVEIAGAHPALTDALNLLSQAQDRVADFIDDGGTIMVMGDYQPLPRPTDTDRLDWLIHHGAQVRFGAEDSRAYIVMPYHCGVPCADNHHRFNTPNEAIDAAMAGMRERWCKDDALDAALMAEDAALTHQQGQKGENQ